MLRKALWTAAGDVRSLSSRKRKLQTALYTGNMA